ncbi:hypothetical protein CHUAL_012131 [Chamberlinius hualienensis]
MSILSSKLGSSFQENQESSFEDDDTLETYQVNSPKYIIFYQSEIEFNDVNSIKKTFNPNPEDILKNPSYSKICSHLKSVSSKTDYDALIVFILAYAKGSCDIVGENNSHTYDVYRNLIHKLVKNSDKGFVGIPKVFIIQTYEAPLKIEKIVNNGPRRAYYIPNIMPKLEVMPQYADIFIAFSSIPGTAKKPNTVNGHLSFIEQLCELINVNKHGLDIEELMTELRRRKHQKNEALPISVSTLRHQFYIKFVSKTKFKFRLAQLKSHFN